MKPTGQGERRLSLPRERRMSPHKRQNTEETEERGLKSFLNLHSEIIGGWGGRDRGEKEREGKAGWLCFFLLNEVFKGN